MMISYGLKNKVVLLLTLMFLTEIAYADRNNGSINGSLSVSQGYANYNIPLVVPPGVAGLTPNIAINYNSGGSINSYLGKKWGLGISVISRCNVQRHRYVKGVNYSAEDSYCLDGRRLYNRNNSFRYYVADSISYNKIESYESQGSGPRYWKIWTKSGQVLEYGLSEDSRIEASGRNDVRVWALNKSSDQLGNSIHYRYYEDRNSGEYYIEDISYANNLIEFNYQQRQPSITHYQAGSKISYTKALANIKTYADGDLAMTWELDRDTSNRLKVLTQCDATGACKDDKQFYYGTSPTRELPILWTSPDSINIDIGGEILVDQYDFNQDGTQDLVTYSPTSSTDNTPAGVSSLFLSIKNGRYERKTLDLDSRSIIYNLGSSRTNSSNTKFFSYVPKSPTDKRFGRINKYTVEFDSAGNKTSGGKAVALPENHLVAGTGDLTGNGRQDILSYEARAAGDNRSVGGNTLYAQVKGQEVNRGKIIVSALFNIPAGHIFGPGGDFNGDGLVDFISYAPKSKDDARHQGSANVYVSLGANLLGSLGYSTHSINSLGGSNFGVTADYNGDGLSDILTYTSNSAKDSRWSSGQANIHLSLGSGGFKHQSVDTGINQNGQVMSAVDVDLDGDADLYSYLPMDDKNVQILGDDNGLKLHTIDNNLNFTTTSAQSRGGYGKAVVHQNGGKSNIFANYIYGQWK